MARQTQPVEVNKFNAGLITDASPLTSPENSSLDEDNFVLNIDGSRNRRLGMDYEDGYNVISTTINGASPSGVGTSTYRWDNAGGDPEVSILVVQINNEVKFYLLGQNSVSNSLIHTEIFPQGIIPNPIFSYAVVDGILVIVKGEGDIHLLEFKKPSTITRKVNRLQIRDLFGVEDIISGIDLHTRGVTIRPDKNTPTNNHIYNLRNQSWAVPRIDGDATEEVRDPLEPFVYHANYLPSNADAVTQALYANPAVTSGSKTAERFFGYDIARNPIGTSHVAQGYFIIDALNRGASRMAAVQALYAQYAADLVYPITSLATDSTPGGARVIAEFAGRLFYGGFSGEVVNGDSRSPRMSSYVLFSKVVTNPDDIWQCYQEADPTNKDDPNLVDTDGGFIRVNEAYGIQRLVNIGSALIVIASNGVWRIVGGNDKGFTATSYIVEKISDKGCSAFDSVVEADGSVMFWGDDGIYHVAPDQFGTLVCNNITFGRIQRLFDNISLESRRNAKGEFDRYERKIRWIWNNHMNTQDEVRELVLDMQLQAFYPNTIKKLNGVYPKPVSTYVGDSYQIIDEDDGLSDASNREVGYLVITQLSPVIRYTFAKYKDREFRDWKSVNGVGVDAEAFMITGYMSGGDHQRDKGVTYITVHMKRTEKGYDDVMNPLHASSCRMQARWSWSDTSKSGKWGRDAQVYRYRRTYVPVDQGDDGDNGFVTVSSKNKLRGNGKVLSLRFKTEPYKNCHLYGWSMLLTVSENV